MSTRNPTMFPKGHVGTVARSWLFVPDKTELYSRAPINWAA